MASCAASAASHPWPIPSTSSTTMRSGVLWKAQASPQKRSPGYGTASPAICAGAVPGLSHLNQHDGPVRPVKTSRAVAMRFMAPMPPPMVPAVE